MCRARDKAETRIRIGRERLNDGTFKYFVDAAGNANGRGAYVCATCIGEAVKKRALNRSFKGNVPDEIYELLQNLPAADKICE